METGNTTWIITFDSDGPKIQVTRRPAEKVTRRKAPKMECPSQKETLPEWDSGIYLSNDKGARVNMIRILYSICRQNLLVGAQGGKLPDCRVFEAFGTFFHTDFSRYCNDLNRAMEDNTCMETQTEIFRRMSDSIIRRFDLS